VQDSALSRGEKIRVVGGSTSSLLFGTRLKYGAMAEKVSILMLNSEERCSICSIAYFTLRHAAVSAVAYFEL
jgi:hypothetical protein